MMKIHAPVKDVPHADYKGRWYKVYQAMKKLKPGQWLPVTLEKQVDVRRLYDAARQHGFRTAADGLTVYIGKRAG